LVGIWFIGSVQKPSHHFLQTFRPLRMFMIVSRDSSLYPKQLSSFCLLRLISASAEQGWQVLIFKLNSRNFAFFKVVWHEKMEFGMYIIVWHFLAFFDGVGMKNDCLAVFKTPGSVTAVNVELYNFFSSQRSSLFCHGPTVEDKSGFAV